MEYKKQLEISINLALVEFTKRVKNANLDREADNSIYNINLHDFISICNQKGINTKFVDKGKEVSLLIHYQEKLDLIRNKKDLTFEEVKALKLKVKEILTNIDYETTYNGIEGILKLGIQELQKMQEENIREKHLDIFMNFAKDYNYLIYTTNSKKILNISKDM